MTQPNITPEGFRTAAYLATRQRIDAARSRSGKTLKRVTCNPPNVQCGGRCIPPNWDCRLKGQGADPQLRAVQTDPVGGLANIERGVKRIAKGVTKGSFSEIEGGKRAIVRGVVKATPGDIQRKKELAAKLERQGARIAVGLAVVGSGLGIHSLLMKRNTLGYRDGVGANINNAVRLGVNKVLDATPIIKTERERKRARAQAGVEAALMRQTNPVSKQLTNQLARTGVSAADEDSRSNLINNLNKVYNNPELSGPQSDFNEWNRAHQRAFWSTTRKEIGVGLATGERGSIFARPATDEFLTRQFNLQGDDTLTPAAIKDAISRNLETYKEDLVNLAQQQGFQLQTVAGGKRVIAKNDRRQFIKGVVQSSLPKGQANDAVRSAFTKHLEQTLSKNPATLAGEIYRDTYRGFDDFYKTKATTIRAATAEPFLSQPLRQAGATETLLDANQSRAAFISGKRTAGPLHAELVLRQHHAEVVRRAPGARFEVSDRVAVQAIEELTGNTVSPREAFRLLNNEHGFSGIRRVGGAVEPRRPGRRAQVELSDLARQLREAARARGEEMSMEASIRAAKAELARRQRGDALPPGLLRTATYLAVRADLRGEGKPCGASHIPKAHECRIGAGGKAAPESESTKPSGRGKKLALAAGGAALLAGGALAYKNRKPIAAAAGALNTERKAQTERVVAELSKNTIKTLSRDDVDAGIAKLPKKFQEPVRQLVGDAKVSAAHLALKTKGGQITSVDVDNNFSNWKMPDGTLLSTGSVKDTLVIYNTKPQASIGGAQTFATQFRVDGEFDAKSVSASRNATSVVSTVKKMFQSQMEQIPDNSIITAIPYANDKKGRQRRAIYQRYGFRQASASDERLFAMKTKGKFTKMKDSHLEQIADFIRNDTKLDKEDSRLGKPCGASHIPKAHKCRKGAGAIEREERKLYEKSTTKAERAYVEKHGMPKDTLSVVEAQLELEKASKQKAQQPTKSNKAAKIAIGVGVTAVGALAVTAALDAHRFLKPRDLPAPASFKSVVQTQRKQAGTKLTSGEALGRHYDSEVSAGRLKAGDVVYTVQNIRGDASSGRHFAVYLGKAGDNHQFLEMTRVAGDLNRGQAMLTEFGATAGRPAYAAVYAKAPRMKQDKQISVNEIKNRAYSLMGSSMQYHQLDSNCETFARMIAAGNPRSKQIDKLSLLTKGIYRGLDKYLDEDRPVNLPTVREQARILDYKQRIAEGDRAARQELKAFTTLISKRKQRNDAVEDLFTDLPSPSELLRDSKSEIEDATRIKLYLMLLLTQSRTLMKHATP